MAIEDTLRSLREFQLSDLDFDTVGVWPMPVKIVIALLLFILVVDL